jgi:hypothetical protein
MWAVCRANGTQQVLSRQGHAKAIPLPHLPTGTIVVGELGCGSQAACHRRAHLGHPFLDVFDLLQVDGQDVSPLDDTARRTLLEATWTAWPPTLRDHFPLVPRISTGFRALYEAEAEGIVLKQVANRPSQPYVGFVRDTCNK